jgi:hypothetical protein
MNEFHFHSKLELKIMLGIKAKNASQLLDAIKIVPDSSIYYHTHGFLQQHHYLSPEPPSDFSYWIGGVLNDKLLAEQLSSIDIVRYNSIAEIRTCLVTAVESFLRSDGVERECRPGEEFYFMASQLFVLPTRHVVHNLTEFRHVLEIISLDSLYFHVFDARLRVIRDENDFSRWFKSIGCPGLAEEVRELDPYAYTLEGLRKRILVMVRNHDRN